MNLTPLVRPAIFYLFLSLVSTNHLMALEFPEAQQAEAWLLTYGPGELYWQRFGHNSIWIRDQERGIDHSFNFGYFDFNQPGFLKRFVQGRMLYFGAAFDPAAEIQDYQQQGRTIRAQRLNLAPDQVLALERYLVNAVQPEYRDYLYDYFYANCSTRVRDALDQALDGALHAATGEQAGEQTIREHVNRLSWPDTWLFLGLQSALGSPIDGPATNWEEAFIPAELADMVAAFSFAGGQPLVTETLYDGRPATVGLHAAGPVWWRYLAWGGLPALVLLAVGALLLRNGPPGRSYALLSLAWPVFAGIAGSFLLYLWLGTNHAAAANNWSLLILNPLLLAGASWTLHKPTRAAQLIILLLVAGWLAAAGAWLLTIGQDNPSLLAFTLPLTLSSTWLIACKLHYSAAGLVLDLLVGSDHVKGST